MHEYEPIGRVVDPQDAFGTQHAPVLEHGAHELAVDRRVRRLLRWAAGMPTIPDDHSQHGAKSWKDYFRFNTDHKVIGIQYICTTFFFFFVGGLMAMLIRAELAQPGTQIVDAAAYNSLFSTHAVLMIFVFVIPVFAGIANYVLPLMIGTLDMAFPRLNALSFWMLPLAGLKQKTPQPLLESVKEDTESNPTQLGAGGA